MDRHQKSRALTAVIAPISLIGCPIAIVSLVIKIYQQLEKGFSPAVGGLSIMLVLVLGWLYFSYKYCQVEYGWFKKK